MTYLEYEQLASRTCPDLGSLENNLKHMDMGIITEIGEYIDQLKRNFAYGKELDEVNLQEEWADINWYVANKKRLQGPVYQNKMFIKYEGQDDFAFMSNMLGSYLITKDVYELEAKLLKFVELKGWDISKLYTMNIEKLKKRFPDKFTQENALNRDLDQEREVLEQWKS